MVTTTLFLPFLLSLNLLLLFYYIWVVNKTNEQVIDWAETIPAVQNIENLFGKNQKIAAKCSASKCLDQRKCLLHPMGHLTIHVQPMIGRIFDKDGHSIDCASSSISTEFLDIRQHFLHSQFHKPNPEAACVILPGLDTLFINNGSGNQFWMCLEAAKSLLPPKSNLLLLNFLLSSHQFHQRPFPLPVIFASAQHSRQSLRPALDLSIPLPSQIAFQQSSSSNKFISATNLLPFKHRFIDILVFFGSRQNSSPIQVEIIETFTNATEKFPKIQFVMKCPKKRPNQNEMKEEEICEMQNGKLLKLDQLISSSKFVLISEATALPQQFVCRSLQFGAIPIILADQFMPPFHQQLDWSRFSFHFVHSLLPSVPRILHSQSTERLKLMQRRGGRIFRRHFSTIGQILDATLAAVEDQLMPIKMRRTKWEWNCGNADEDDDFKCKRRKLANDGIECQNPTFFNELNFN